MEPADPKTKSHKSKVKNIQKRTLCPFVQSPSQECYFLDMNSNKISMTIYYCQNHYEICEIYKRMKQRKEDLESSDNGAS